MENLLRLKQIQSYNQVDHNKIKKAQRDFSNNYNSKSATKISTSSYSRNNNILNPYYPSNNSNNNKTIRNTFNPILGNYNNGKNMTSNDIITKSYVNFQNNLKYTGYRFDSIKNIAELVELNGTFKKKVASSNSEVNFNRSSTSTGKLKSPWQKIMDKTPNKFPSNIKISPIRKNELAHSNRVLYPNKDPHPEVLSHKKIFKSVSKHRTNLLEDVMRKTPTDDGFGLGKKKKTDYNKSVFKSDLNADISGFSKKRKINTDFSSSAGLSNSLKKIISDNSIENRIYLGIINKQKAKYLGNNVSSVAELLKETFLRIGKNGLSNNETNKKKQIISKTKEFFENDEAKNWIVNKKQIQYNDKINNSSRSASKTKQPNSNIIKTTPLIYSKKLSAQNYDTKINKSNVQKTNTSNLSNLSKNTSFSIRRNNNPSQNKVNNLNSISINKSRSTSKIK